MTVAARKYNPGFLSDDELVASFCVRTCEFNSLTEVLRDCTSNANSHQIVIGPRGSGKTSLLLRVAVEIKRDSILSHRFFPIIFAEESYEVSTAGEFWLECLARLADQAPEMNDGPDLRRTYEELRTIRDDRMLGGRCLGALQDFADRESKRLVLIVENLNMLFGEIGDEDAGWRLRKTLQTDSRIVLLASATSRFDEIDNPDRALYDLFRTVPLRPLDTNECLTLWQTVSERKCDRDTIRAMQILSGGSPRLLAIIARFGGNLSFRELMEDLLDLVDDHTEYFKSHLDALAPQERRVYLALADLWQPATAREIAERARLDTSKCSAQLARLSERGAVEVTGGSARRKLYYLTERLYNFYYLMRRARGPAPLVEALIRFMEAFYSPKELKEFGVRLAREALGTNQTELIVRDLAFGRLLELNSLEAYREELLASAQTTFVGGIGETETLPNKASVSAELSKKALKLAESGQTSDALATWDYLIQRFGKSDAPIDQERAALAFVNIGMAKWSQGNSDAALVAWNEVVKRFGSCDEGPCLRIAAEAMVNKGELICSLGHHKKALTEFDEILRRFSSTKSSVFCEVVAKAHVGRAAVLVALERAEEALESYDEVLMRFGGSQITSIRAEVAAAMAGKGHALIALNRPNAAIEIWGEAAKRFLSAASPRIFEPAVAALANKGVALSRSGQLKEALAAFETVLEFGRKKDVPALHEAVAHSYFHRGNVFAAMHREAEAVASWDCAISCFDEIDTLANAEPFAAALMNKAAVLLKENLAEEAINNWNIVEEKFGESDSPQMLATVANAMKKKGALLEMLDRKEEALANWTRVEQSFGASNSAELLEFVAYSFVHRSNNSFELNRPNEALATCDRAVELFGRSDEPAILDAVACCLVNKGIYLLKLNRNEEALPVWGEIEERFSTFDTTALQKQIAKATVGKGMTLFGLNRPEDAIAAWSEVDERFGKSAIPKISEELSLALLNKGAALTESNRVEDALDVFEDAIRRFCDNEEPHVLESVAKAYINKGVVLRVLERSKEAMSAWRHVVQQFETSNQPSLRNTARLALFHAARFEVDSDRAPAAINFLDRALRHDKAALPEISLQCHLLRAGAYFELGGVEECGRDVETALTILSEINSLPRDTLEALQTLAKEMGSKSLRDQIKASPAADLLLPLTTALEKDLGLEPRVAKEVDEIADDILWEMKNKTNGVNHRPAT